MTAPKTSAGTIDQKDIARFNALANSWWDETGPMKPLHLFTPIRLDYIRKSIQNRGLISAKTSSDLPLAPLKILDIGCGGGLLAEPIARLGATVTAIDASTGAIAAAIAHAEAHNISIDYRCMASEELAAIADYHQHFDVIYASEVIEHVSDIHTFAQTIAHLLAPDGVVVITTINRTMPALLFAKFAAEYIVKIVPAGTHQFEKFVRPAELRAAFRDCGILIDDVTGFVPTPHGTFKMSSITAVNYGAAGSFA